MKKYKGFTLVELIAIIVILGLIVIVIVPNVLKTSKTIKNDSLVAKKENILSSAVMYGNDKDDIFDRYRGCIKIEENNGSDRIKVSENEPEGECYAYAVVTVGELADNKYIKYDEKKDDENIVSNPADDNDFLNNYRIFIYKKHKRTYAIYLEDDGVIKDDCEGDSCSPKDCVGTGCTDEEKCTGADCDVYLVGSVVKINHEHTIVNKEQFRIDIGKSGSFTVEPDEYYYVKSITCTGDLTVSNVRTGKDATEKQTVFIKNNNETSDQECTIETGMNNYKPIPEKSGLVDVTTTCTKNVEDCSGRKYCGKASETDGHGDGPGHWGLTGGGSCTGWHGGYNQGDSVYQGSCTTTTESYSCVKKDCPEGSKKLDSKTCEIYTCPYGGEYNSSTGMCEEKE